MGMFKAAARAINGLDFSAGAYCGKDELLVQPFMLEPQKVKVYSTNLRTYISTSNVTLIT